MIETRAETRLWIKPDTGEERHYLQNWREAIGLKVDWYNTGNIKSACLDGQWISNTRASRITMKPWFDRAITIEDAWPLVEDSKEIGIIRQSLEPVHSEMI